MWRLYSVVFHRAWTGAWNAKGTKLSSFWPRVSALSWKCSSATEDLPNMCKSLTSIPSTEKNVSRYEYYYGNIPRVLFFFPNEESCACVNVDIWDLIMITLLTRKSCSEKIRFTGPSCLIYQSFSNMVHWYVHIQPWLMKPIALKMLLNAHMQLHLNRARH